MPRIEPPNTRRKSPSFSLGTVADGAQTRSPDPGGTSAANRPGKRRVARSQCFTLIELISTLIIVGVMGSVLSSRIIDLSRKTRETCIYTGVREYNGREMVLWAKVLISNEFSDDVDAFDRHIYSEMDPYLDAGNTYDNPGTETDMSGDDDWDYTHSSFGKSTTGKPYIGTLQFQTVTAYVERTPATFEHPAAWHVTGYKE